MSKLWFKQLICAFFAIVISMFFSSCACEKVPEEIAIHSPVVSIDIDNKTISWMAVENAESYDVYKNGGYIKNVTGNNTISVNISEYVLSSNFISFKVIAKAVPGYLNSEFSNEVIYFTLTESSESVDGLQIDNSNLSIVKNINIDNKTISWQNDEAVESNYIYLQTNHFSRHYEIEDNSTSFDFSNYLVNSDPIAIRIGGKVGNKLFYSELKYYNPNGSYNNYYFNGKVLDYYIESQEELNNLFYYMFVNRLTSEQVKYSSTFMNELKSTYSTSSDAVIYSKSLDKALKALNETYSVTLSYSVVAPIGQGNVEIFIGYKEGEVPTITANSVKDGTTVLQTDKEVPYYETVIENDVYSKRDASYNEFVSDKQAMIVNNVSTSEQLYWAIESGATPLVVKNSVADKIYNQAKEVLKTIIFNGMTDYEKALAIFDWISVNTSYGYSVLNAGNTNPMKFTAFYLNSIFDIPEGETLGVAVCDGYSKAFSLLCNMEGVECKRVAGLTNAEYEENPKHPNAGAHAWNKVKINNEWYLVDLTWTEILTVETGNKIYERLSHKYFLVDEDCKQFVLAINADGSIAPNSQNSPVHIAYDKESDALNKTQGSLTFYEQSGLYVTNAEGLNAGIDKVYNIATLSSDNVGIINIMMDWQYFLDFKEDNEKVSARIKTYINNLINSKVTESHTTTIIFDTNGAEGAVNFYSINPNKLGCVIRIEIELQ